MLQEGGEAANDTLLVQILRYFTEAFQRGAGSFRATRPRLRADLVHGKLALQVQQDVPFFLVQISDVRGHHLGRHIGLFTGLHCLAADVADAKGKDAVGRHEQVFLGTGEALQHVGMLGHVGALRHFQGGPELVFTAADFAVGGAQDDVAAERVLFEHELKGGVQLVIRHLPGDEGAFGQLVGQQGLPHTADDTALNHGADALHHSLKRQAALLGDELERMLVESLHTVFAHRQNAGVGFFGVFDGEGVGGHVKERVG